MYNNNNNNNNNNKELNIYKILNNFHDRPYDLTWSRKFHHSRNFLQLIEVGKWSIGENCMSL